MLGLTSFAKKRLQSVFGPAAAELTSVLQGESLSGSPVMATFVATFTQSVGAKTVVVRKNNKVVTLEIPVGTTANGGAGQIASGATDLPAAYRPAADLTFPCVVKSNNVKTMGKLVVAASGIMTFSSDATGANFTTAQPAGFDRLSVSYTVA